jgi:6-phosphogluconolactonase (cycloisomerase 2 family)
VQFLSKVASGGAFPTSIAVNGDLVYVLNARGTPNVNGFRLNADGTLTALANSTRNLPGGAGAAPADVRFSQDGTLLLVTETGTNQIDVFQVQNDGSITEGVAMAASGKKPFGVEFATRDRVIVTEAGTASVSSYNLNDSNGLETISASVPNHQMASCWVALTNDKTFAYVSNTGSGTISSYQVDQHGNLTLAKAVAAATEIATSAPIDSAMSDDSKFLYVLESTLGKILVFSVDGPNLTRVAVVGGLPTSIQGIAAQ